ncbi:MAG: DNA primase catalytic subunit PriS [Candidatus Bilamarchaeaceae archaeon]
MEVNKNDVFVRNVFSRYYQNAHFDIKRIDQREFGIGNYKKIDTRHLSFSTTEQFRNFLISNPPYFVSHSAAYYQFPSATPIEKKGRIGADLIFDLDMHADGKYDVYPKLLDMREDVIRLVEDFLIADFGLKKEEILIAFSGNRGYHVHVRSDDYLCLGGDERKEITNYIRAEGLRIRDLFFWEELRGKKEMKKLLGPKPTDGGYRGRLAKLVIKKLKDNPASISKIFLNEEKRNFFISGIIEGNWSRTSLKLDDLLKRLDGLKQELAVMSINADPAVTYDMSKLIRVPNSIHGETGFVAKIVADIYTFEPLRHAVINGPEVSVEFLEETPQLEMLNQTFGKFSPGDKVELPLGVALFFILKNSAKKL